MRQTYLHITVTGLFCALLLTWLSQAAAVVQRARCLSGGFQAANAACADMANTNTMFYALATAATMPAVAEPLLWRELTGERSQVAAAQLISLLAKQDRWSAVPVVLEKAALLPDSYVYRLIAPGVSSATPAEANRWIAVLAERYGANPVLAATAALVAQDYEVLEAIIQAVPAGKRTDAEQGLWAASLFQRQRYGEAAAIWKGLLAHSPENKGFLYWYARSLRNGGEHQESLHILQQLVSDAGVAAAPDQLFELALAYRDNQRCEDALAVVTRARTATTDPALQASLALLEKSMAECPTNELP